MNRSYLMLGFVLLVTSVSLAQTEKPADEEIANAYLRVEYGKLLMQSTLVAGEKAKIELASDAKLPTEVIVEIGLERLCKNHAESMLVNGELAKQMLAGTFRDEENRKYIKATAESLGENTAQLPAYVKALFRMSSRSTQWKLEATRRLLEPFNTGQAAPAHENQRKEEKPKQEKKRVKKEKKDNQEQPAE